MAGHDESMDEVPSPEWLLLIQTVTTPAVAGVLGTFALTDPVDGLSRPLATIDVLPRAHDTVELRVAPSLHDTLTARLLLGVADTLRARGIRLAVVPLTSCDQAACAALESSGYRRAGDVFWLEL